MSSRRNRTRRTAPSEREARYPAEPREGWVFLPLTAGDFRSGWALDWSPELHSSPLPRPRRDRPETDPKHPG